MSDWPGWLWRLPGPYGFALAGGYAVQVHGFLERPSMDVDIFAGTSPAPDFGGGVDAVVAALRGQGLQVDTELRNARFARLAISSADQAAKMEFGVDWRMNAPVMLPIGPVLHADDAVANKVCALVPLTELREHGRRILGQRTRNVARFHARDGRERREGSGWAGCSPRREVARDRRSVGAVPAV
jgi:hypothetical protein